MSRDYNIFLKDADRINSSNFELFAYRAGCQIRIYPCESYTEHTGFLPFNLRPDFVDLPCDSLLSGFETYFMPYCGEDMGEELNRLIQDADRNLLISIGSEDSFEEFCALLFAAYLCESFGAVLYDPQSDSILSKPNEILSRLNEEKRRLSSESDRGMLRTHEFTSWR